MRGITRIRNFPTDENKKKARNEENKKFNQAKQNVELVFCTRTGWGN